MWWCRCVSMRARLTLLVCLAAAHSVSAQRRCTHTTATEDAGLAEESWAFDASGRVRRVDEDNYFYARSESYRYDRRGRLTHTDLLQYTGGGVDFQPRGPVATRISIDDAGRVTREIENVSWTDRQVVLFDDHGRPARAEVGRRGSDSTTTFECTYDLGGRPIHRRALHRRAGRLEHDFATHWQWRDGRLARVIEESDEEDRVFEVHHRGNTVHVVSANHERETWTGTCAPVFFGACSPALNPTPPGRRRASVPALRSRPPRWREATTQPPLVGRALRQRLELTRLRAAYPGYHVWTDVTFAESSPGTAIPVVCVASNHACSTRIHYDGERRWRRVTTQDPMFAVGGVRVGDRAGDLEGDLGECVHRGDIGYVQCDVRGAHATVLLAVPEGSGLSGDQTVEGDALADLRVAEIEVRATE